VARVRDVAATPHHHLRADGPGVRFAAVPYYVGPWQYFCKRRAVIAAVRRALGPDDAVIMRVGSQLANCLFPVLHRAGRPYGVEVVGDPWDVFSPGAVRHPLRAFFRRYAFWHLRTQCAQACAAAYVTDYALQRRYPAHGSSYVTAYSSVELAQGAITERWSAGGSEAEVTEKRLRADATRAPNPNGPIRLVFVGALAQLYKAPDVLLKSMAKCVRAGLDLELVMIGDGRCRAALERRAAHLGLAQRVFFRGQLPAGDAVREELDRGDIFVLPSRQEGLPRAMIEAMARALPCIGSSVGGIPELLPPEDLVPPENAAALATKIREVATDPARLQRMAARNLERAKDFRDNLLRERRLAFYRFVRQRTEEWLQQQNP
jgi:glycosyltransferase involved in cell wall biosynthesis